jgi:hypothetical protein
MRQQQALEAILNVARTRNKSLRSPLNESQISVSALQS